MTSRILVPGDEAKLDAFLSRHADSSVILRSNLRIAGLVDRGEPYHATYAAELDGDELVGVVAHAWNGNLVMQAPLEVDGLARAAVVASGRPVKGLLGPAAQVERARERLGLADAPTGLRSTEDLFAIDTARVIVPDALFSGAWRCRVASSEDLELVTGWRRDFVVQALGTPDSPSLVEELRRESERKIAERAIALLDAGSGPVSMSVFTARLPDTVQIGSVWTPNDLRGRGYARGVVAGQLLLARPEGIRRAVLFTGKKHASAQRTYRAIGFEVVGDYGITIFKGPVQLR